MNTIDRINVLRRRAGLMDVTHESNMHLELNVIVVALGLCPSLKTSHRTARGGWPLSPMTDYLGARLARIEKAAFRKKGFSA